MTTKKDEAEAPKTGRSAVFYIGVFGLIIEESARLALGIPPSIPMITLFGSFVTGAGIAAAISGFGIKITRDDEKKD